MRDLTEEELKLAPAECDHYNIIDGKVYFTDVLGIDVFDIDGNEINNCIMDNKVFAKSRPLPKKPFDISEHEFSSGDFVDVFTQGERLHIYIAPYYHGRTWFNNGDIAAMAKALGVTAEDLK